MALARKVDTTNSTQDQLVHLSAKDIVLSGERIERKERISVRTIRIESHLVDEGHARNLARNMDKRLTPGSRGQISEVTVAARMDEDGTVYHLVTDGYHRIRGKQLALEEKEQRGELITEEDQFIDAKVLYACDDQELANLRILAASSVKAVQFPRLVRWMYDSYSQTKWAGRLTILQAFTIAAGDTSRSNLGLTPDEVEEVRLYGLAMSETWQRPIASSILPILRIAADADPHLIEQVRASGGGLKDHAGRVTQTRLEAISSAFPGSEYYGAQNGLIRIVVERRLSKNQALQLVQIVKGEILPGANEEAVYNRFKDVALESNTEGDAEDSDFPEDIFSGTNWNDLNGPSEADLDRIAAGDELAGDVTVEDTKVLGNGRRGALAESNGKVGFNGPTRRIVQQNGAASVRKPRLEGDTQDRIAQLKEQVMQLQAALAEAKKTGAVSNDGWWRTLPTLTREERACLVLTLDGHDELSVVAKKMGLTEMRVFSLIRSAYVKNSIANETIEIPEE